MCSILALIAVLFAPVPSIHASTMQMGRICCCHRRTVAAEPKASMHDCHGMFMGMHQDSTAESGLPAVSPTMTQQCPMNCCGQNLLSTPAALSFALVSAAPAGITSLVHPTRISFVSAGFSSHTDRGPPSL